ncbi:type VII secretion target [Lentzea sp. NPDC051213]|uniref:type VII secretion target n=1 Tax=Lentzea sp. NPDC051213 TaxID=3364126 RepID=UPI0037960CA2
MTSGGQFTVSPEDLMTFAANVQSISDQIGTSKGVIDSVKYTPTVWGIVGGLFYIAVDKKLKNASTCIGQYEAGMREAAKNIKLTADTYSGTDEGNANAFSGGY